MAQPGLNLPSDREEAEDAESGFDFDLIRNILGFVVRAVRRHLALAGVTFVLVAGLGIGVAAALPPMYTAQVKLLAQRGSALRMFTSLNPAMEAVDSPTTKNVATTILRHDNLVSLAREADLVRRFHATRPPILRFKDRVLADLFGVPSDDDMLSVMAFTLERQLNVEVPDDSTVVLSADWSDPRTAYDLVTLVQKNFQEARYDSDVAVINDSIAVLEDRAKNALQRVDDELDAYRKVLADRATAERALRAAEKRPEPPPATGFARRATAATPSASAASVPDPDSDVTKTLEEKRRRIRDMEDAHDRTLSDLKQQLSQAELTLTPLHPTVIALQQRIDALNQPSPELQQLKSEERALMAEIVPLPAPAPIGPAVPYVPPPPRYSEEIVDAGADADSAEGLPAPPNLQDGVLQLAQSKLGAAIHAYQDAMGRIDAAKVELDVTGTAYKHRYVVVNPAAVPRKPKKATARNLATGSLAGGLLLAILLSAALDLISGRILESWQVRKQLKLDVLAEFDGPA